MTRIKDIAKKAKLSSSTVSRVLNNDKNLNVKIETRRRVLDIAKKLNYTKHIKTEKNNYSVGILLWFTKELELEDGYYQGIRKCIEHNLLINGIEGRLIYSDRNLPEKSLIVDLDAIIAVGKFSEKVIDYYLNLCPIIIMVDSFVKGRNIDSVGVDLYSMSIDVLEILKERFSYSIGFIGGRENYTYSGKQFIDFRERAYNDFMGKRKKSIRIGEFTLKSGYEMMKSIIKQDNLFKSYFIANDYMAMGAIKALNEEGIDLYNQINIISVDNLDFTNYCNPTITSVELPRMQMGETAVELVIERLKGRTYPKKVELGYKISWKETLKAKTK